MASADEEARATAYREQSRTRYLAQRERALALRAPRANRTALEADWQPWIDEANAAPLLTADGELTVPGENP